MPSALSTTTPTTHPPQQSSADVAVSLAVKTPQEPRRNFLPTGLLDSLRSLIGTLQWLIDPWPDAPLPWTENRALSIASQRYGRAFPASAFPSRIGRNSESG
ncbi:hypothetical protein EBO15_03740 [Actinomadura harenae]|uniref:Uncharacterized protein n=1 Tax=Actinomadura harenae TaxID=2483351 RepID=A0A3M2MIY0_9ACTN|nr:hypothetical protein EBO15_03740 [Actinomadura harenae]